MIVLRRWNKVVNYTKKFDVYKVKPWRLLTFSKSFRVLPLIQGPWPKIALYVTGLFKCTSPLLRLHHSKKGLQSFFSLVKIVIRHYDPLSSPSEKYLLNQIVFQIIILVLCQQIWRFYRNLLESEVRDFCKIIKKKELIDKGIYILYT